MPVLTKSPQIVKNSLGLIYLETELLWGKVCSFYFRGKFPAIFRSSCTHIPLLQRCMEEPAGLHWSDVGVAGCPCLPWAGGQWEPLWLWSARPGPQGVSPCSHSISSLLTIWVTFLLGAAFRDNLWAFLVHPDTSPPSVPGTASSGLKLAFAFSYLRN